MGCVEEYATTYPWDRFSRKWICARDVSGVKTATVKESQPEGVFSLDGRRLKHRAVTTHGLVGLRDYSHHLIAALHKGTEAGDGKVGRAHKHYSQFFFLHTLRLFSVQRYAFFSIP